MVIVLPDVPVVRAFELSPGLFVVGDPFSLPDESEVPLLLAFRFPGPTVKIKARVIASASRKPTTAPMMIFFNLLPLLPFDGEGAE